MRKAVTLLVVMLLCVTSQATSQEGGWRSLFNGVDLSGWSGDVDGYAVEDGSLVSLRDGGGNLYVDGEYDDFVLQFSFRLEEGGNNGVGIRAERGKDAAYNGMEIQVLDDYAAQYAELHPWQFHGSIYGVVPATRGALKPAGEWNQEEIRADGSHVTVTVNGEVVVDADIREAARNGTIDGREHPGLFNGSGAIGFLGHGSRVEFRDIRIRELP